MQRRRRSEITERRRAAFVEASLDCVVTIDRDGRVIDCNPAAERAFGYPREEVLGRPVAEFIDLTKYRPIGDPNGELFARPASGRRLDRVVELTATRKDGTTFPAEVWVTALFVDGGRVYTASLRDVTGRKRAERQAQAEPGGKSGQRQMHSSIRRAQSEIITERNFDATFRHLLTDVLKLTGSAGGVIAEVVAADDGPTLKPCATVGEHGPAAGLDDLFREVVATGRPVRPTAAPHGRPFLGLPFHHGGELLGVAGLAGRVGGYDDATVERLQPFLTTCATLVRGSRAECERQSAERALVERGNELREANARLARSTRLKDEFLASMSHELRTPLHAVLGMSEALRAGAFGPVGPAQVDALTTIEESGRHLLHLINDILDLSKVEAGHLELAVDDVDAATLGAACVRMVRESAGKKSITLAYKPGSGVGTLAADPLRLKQVLLNLLSNAIKFTPPFGSVELEIAADAASGGVRFEVRDTGIGIAAADLPRLFQPFVQLDSSLARPHGGTGLGLCLVRRLAELHGGRVEVASEPGRGSRFSVVLPRSAAPGTAPARRGDAAGDSVAGSDQWPAGIKVLVVDDHEAIGRLLHRYLSSRRFDVDVVHSGADALEAVRRRPPDVALIDIQMPDLDGLTVIRALRGDPATARVRVIALTALAMAEDRDRCLAAGADEYLTKPISLERLARVVAQLSSRE